MAAIYGELAETLRHMADEPHPRPAPPSTSASPQTQPPPPPVPPRVPRLEKAAAAYRNALALDHTQVREKQTDVWSRDRSPPGTARGFEVTRCLPQRPPSLKKRGPQHKLVGGVRRAPTVTRTQRSPGVLSWRALPAAFAPTVPVKGARRLGAFSVEAKKDCPPQISV